MRKKNVIKSESIRSPIEFFFMDKNVSSIKQELKV